MSQAINPQTKRSQEELIINHDADQNAVKNAVTLFLPFLQHQLKLVHEKALLQQLHHSCAYITS